MQPRQPPHDGPAQAAAALAATQHAEEALAQARAVGVRQARAGVLHHQPRALARRGRGHLHRHAAAIGAVAQRVVEQVAQQHGGQRAVHGHGHGLPGPLQVDVLAARLRRALQILRLLRSDGGQVALATPALARVGVGHLGLQPRQLQQLLHQPRGAVAAGNGGGQRGAALVVLRGALRHLRLHADAGDRCAQLVRGVGGEAALARQLLVHALEQAVERAHQRAHLGQHAVLGQRLQRVRVARGHAGAQGAQRAHGAAHRPPDAGRQQRQRHQQRQQRAAQAGQQHVAAGRGLLADVDDVLDPVLVEPGGGEHAPAGAADALVRQAARGRRRHRRLGRVGRARMQLALVPDLERHARLVFVQQRRRLHHGIVVVVHLAGGQQRGGLRQVGIQQLVQLVLGDEPRHRHRAQPGDQHEAQHHRRQALGERPGAQSSAVHLKRPKRRTSSATDDSPTANRPRSRPHAGTRARAWPARRVRPPSREAREGGSGASRSGG